MLLVFAVLVCTIRQVAEPDCWFHMAFGRYVIEHGSLPRTDVFSFTGFGNPWISTGWLPSLLMHIAFEKFLSWGLIGIVALTIVPTILAIYYTGVRVFGNRGSIVLILLLAIAAMYLRFTPRPEIFSLALLTAVMLILVVTEHSMQSGGDARPLMLWVLPLIFALWANLHGGFFIGFVPVALFAAAACVRWWRPRQRRHLLAILPCSLCALSWLLNPYGPSIAKLISEVSNVPSLKTHLFEYMPLLVNKSGSMLPWPATAGVVLLALTSAGVLIAQRGRVPWWQVLLAAGFILLEFRERRHIGMSTVVLSTVVLPYLGSLDRVLLRYRQVLPAIATSLVLSLTLLKYTGHLGVSKGLFDTGRDRTLLPYVATKWMEANRPPGNMFNTYGPGGYLMYFLGPETKVFIDGRFFVYDPQVWEDFLAAQNGGLSIDEVCQRYDIKTFFVRIADDISLPNHLANRLTARTDFKLVYFSDYYAMFVKDEPSTHEYLKSREFDHITPFDAGRIRMALADASKTSKVFDELKRAREISEGSAASWGLTAVAYHIAGDLAKSREAIQEGINRFPKNQRLRLLNIELGLNARIS